MESEWPQEASAVLRRIPMSGMRPGGKLRWEQTRPFGAECSEEGRLRRMSGRDCNTALELVWIMAVALEINWSTIRIKSMTYTT